MLQDSESLDKTLDLVRDILTDLSGRNTLYPSEWEKSAVYVTGVALWDIFSNNHKVVNSNERILEMGSWRACGEYIAEMIETDFPDEPFYDYMDFYKGSIYQLPGEIDLFPVYLEIFKILKKNHCDWHCAFPELLITQIRNGIPAEDTGELHPLVKSLSEAYNKILKKRDRDPLRAVIEAYVEVYHKFPDLIPEE